MGFSIPSSTVAAGSGTPQARSRRRPPSAAEQARRKKWAETWAHVGRDWKRNREAKGLK